MVQNNIPLFNFFNCGARLNGDDASSCFVGFPNAFSTTNYTRWGSRALLCAALMFQYQCHGRQ